MTPMQISIHNITTASFVQAKACTTPIIDDGKGPYKFCRTCKVEHPLYVFRKYIAADGRESYNPSCRTKYRSIRA